MIVTGPQTKGRRQLERGADGENQRHLRCGDAVGYLKESAADAEARSVRLQAAVGATSRAPPRCGQSRGRVKGS